MRIPGGAAGLAHGPRGSILSSNLMEAATLSRSDFVCLLMLSAECAGGRQEEGARQRGLRAKAGARWLRGWGGLGHSGATTPSACTRPSRCPPPCSRAAPTPALIHPSRPAPT